MGALDYDDDDFGDDDNNKDDDDEGWVDWINWCDKYQRASSEER